MDSRSEASSRHPLCCLAPAGSSLYSSPNVLFLIHAFTYFTEMYHSKNSRHCQAGVLPSDLPFCHGLLLPAPVFHPDGAGVESSRFGLRLYPAYLLILLCTLFFQTGDPHFMILQISDQNGNCILFIFNHPIQFLQF